MDFIDFIGVFRGSREIRPEPGARGGGPASAGPARSATRPALTRRPAQTPGHRSHPRPVSATASANLSRSGGTHCTAAGPRSASRGCSHITLWRRHVRCRPRIVPVTLFRAISRSYPLNSETLRLTGRKLYELWGKSLISGEPGSRAPTSGIEWRQ